VCSSDIGQGGFPQPRRAEYQGVVERFTAATGRADKNFHLLAYFGLANVIAERTRPDGAVKLFFTRHRLRTDKAIGFNHRISLAPLLAEGAAQGQPDHILRSEERRVGKECRSRWPACEV